jgi:large subunit ribosomal protein L4
MAMSLDVRGVDGGVTSSVALDEAIFGIQPNVPVLHQVVTAQLAAARSGTNSTKTRAEVSGGGRKPFKQKGTGRARQGSERAPHFTGGGVALGPKPRSYRQRTPRKMIQLALRSALSDRASDGKVVVIESWPWDVPSTKAASASLDALGLGGKVLVVLGPSDDDAYKSFRNLPAVQLIMASELNAYDILCNDWILFSTATLPGGPGAVEPGPSAEGSAEEPSGTELLGVEPATDDEPAPSAPASVVGDDREAEVEAKAAMEYGDTASSEEPSTQPDSEPEPSQESPDE